MKKILHVITTLDNCGTEKYLINLLQGTYKQYDNYILIYKDKNMWKDKLNEMGIKVFCVDNNKDNFKRIKFIRKTIKENKIDILYSYTYYNSAFVLLASVFTCVKKRIVHSHRTNVDRKINPIKKFFSKLVISILANKCLACNVDAGKSLFLPFRKIKVINNSIDINEYIFNMQERNKIRADLKIKKNDIVIGTIGRLDYNKNQLFLINVFNNYMKLNESSKLIIIGDGEERENLVKYINKNNLSDSIMLLGNKSDANRYYSVMDVFVLTSYNEGLPFVLIEAQANGLSCVVSDCVSKEAKINKNVVFLSINEDINNWVDSIDIYSKKREKNIDNVIRKYSLNSMYEYIIKEVYEG